jgi:hypothetical protein
MCIEAVSHVVYGTQNIVYEGIDTTKRCFERNFNCTVEDLALKIYNVTVFILIALSASALCYYNSPFFALGAFSALFYKESFDDAILRVQMIWQAQGCCKQVCMITAGLAAWPIVLSLSSILMGAYLSSSLQDEAFSIVEQREGCNDIARPHPSPESPEERLTMDSRPKTSLPPAAQHAHHQGKE